MSCRSQQCQGAIRLHLRFQQHHLADNTCYDYKTILRPTFRMRCATLAKHSRFTKNIPRTIDAFSAKPVTPTNQQPVVKPRYPDISHFSIMIWWFNSRFHLEPTPEVLRSESIEIPDAVGGLLPHQPGSTSSISHSTMKTAQVECSNPE